MQQQQQQQQQTNGVQQEQQQQQQQPAVGFAEPSELSAVYGHLRERGWVVRPGLQYGAHFAAYRHHPELVHSRYDLPARYTQRS